MTPIADMVELMFADGATPSLIVLAIRSVETIALRERDGVTHASRTVTLPSQTQGAIRARRARAKHKQNQGGAKANDVASVGDPPRDDERYASRHDVTPRTTLLPSLSLNLEGSIEEGSSGRKKARSENARARGERMISGAILTDEFRQAAVDLGARSEDVPNMWAEFADYWVAVPGQRGVKLDWLATWRNDVRRKLERGPRNGRAKQQSLSDLAGDLAEQARSLERARGLV